MPKNNKTCGAQDVLLTGIKLNLYHTICAPRQLTSGFTPLITPNLHQLATSCKNAFGMGVWNIVEGGLREEYVLGHDWGSGGGG